MAHVVQKPFKGALDCLKGVLFLLLFIVYAVVLNHELKIMNDWELVCVSIICHIVLTISIIFLKSLFLEDRADAIYIPF